MDALTLLTTRYSSPRLREPAPEGEALNLIKRAAIQVPDHGALRPWRFVVAEGRDALTRLGDIFAEAAIEEDPSISIDMQERARQLPMRAPMVIICIAKITEHAKVPSVEQVQSVACSVMAMQQMAFALGFGGIWRTGAYAQYDYVKQAFKLDADDEIVGFLYLGTPSGQAPQKSALEPEAFFSDF
ncbi:NAD(P)H nitroreductase [Alishewanella sp. SMS8]|uniref:NAD(P)H nitroreductase n=1 Tax=unclassified Alishewanella TaxID=2628974 RepID=UPI00274106CB|nr:NAD(P)H nitroreductase [Alishewanella sp. SMS8]MDP5035608.1 NAD(P)H nitroreductase [Alishewanella sp.]MDP5186685.1 NAD(P)H nitroreductase [Alishewanella sp.]MDP5460706.1 NAD(P)H nitroreductase [Alishewanella sp. SMS8]